MRRTAASTVQPHDVGTTEAHHPATKRSGRVRTTLVALLVVVGSLVAPVAITALWLKATLLDTHQYVATVGPLSSNKAIDDAVGADVTSAVFKNVDVTKTAKSALPSYAKFLARPLGAGIKDAGDEAVARFLHTGEFRTLWIAANTQAHQALLALLEGRSNRFVGADGSVSINLTNITNHARQAAKAAGFKMHGKVVSHSRRIVLVKAKALDKARHTVTALKRVALGLPAAALVLAGLALAISRRRRRTIFWIGVGLLAGAIGELLIVALARWYLVDHVVGTTLPPSAARALYDTLLRSLRFNLELTCLAGVLVAAAAVLAGAPRIASRLRLPTLNSQPRVG